MSGTMWLTIKTIKVRLLQLQNGNWLITVSTAQTFFETKECCKNNALLLSVMPHTRSLTKFVNTSKNSIKLSNVCKTLAKNIGEA